MDKETARRLWHRKLGTDGSTCPTGKECRAFDAGFEAALSETAAPKERVARITLRNPDLIRRCRIEINGQLEVLEAGEKMDIALAEKDRV